MIFKNLSLSRKAGLRKITRLRLKQYKLFRICFRLIFHKEIITFSINKQNNIIKKIIKKLTDMSLNYALKQLKLSKSKKLQ